MSLLLLHHSVLCAADAAVTSAAAAGAGSLRVRTCANGLPPNGVPAISPRVSVTPGATPAAAGAAAFADQISPLPSPGQSWHAVLASGEQPRRSQSYSSSACRAPSGLRFTARPSV